METADDILRKVYQSIEYCLGKGALIAREEEAISMSP